jgi:hypothetical protein
MVGACGAADAPEASRQASDASQEWPALVGEGVISTGDRHQTFPAEDPVSGDLWFSVYDDDFDEQTILVSRPAGTGWAAPEVAPFSGEWGDRAPRFSPDGSELYFTSDRPVSPGGAAGDMNIWRVTREDGSWSAPEPVAAPVSSEAPDIHVAVSRDSYWVPSRREGTLGRSDIFRVSRSRPRTVEHLPAPINDELSQPDLWISPDETWMILVITDHRSGLGGDDLYVSRREGSVWSEPRNLGSPVNSDEYEYGPSLSRDGRYLYFSSHRAGTSNIYRIPLEEVPLAGAPG